MEKAEVVAKLTLEDIRRGTRVLNNDHKMLPADGAIFYRFRGQYPVVVHKRPLLCFRYYGEVQNAISGRVKSSVKSQSFLVEAIRWGSQSSCSSLH